MRQIIVNTLFVICGLASFTTNSAAEEAKPLPPAAQTIMDKLEKSEDKLNREHIKAVNAERVDTIKDLTKVMKDITKTGDLDNALLVKKQIEELNAKIDATESTDLLGQKKEINYGKILAGEWNFQKSNGFSGVMEIMENGTLSAKLTTPIPLTVQGKWEVDKKTELVKLIWGNDANRTELLKFSPPDKLAGDSFDAGNNGFTATRKK